MALTSSYQYIGRSNGLKAQGRSYYYYILLYAKTVPNNSTGVHTVYIKEILACTADSTFYDYSTAYSGTINGSSAFSGTNLPTESWSSSDSIEAGGYTYRRHTVIAEGSKTVSCTDGLSHNINIGCQWKFTANSSAVYVPSHNAEATVSATVTLPAIPRGTTPTLSPSSLYMGETMIINMPRAVSTYKHTLTYTFGNATGTIGSNLDTAASWTVPMELANQIPGAISTTGTIRCSTYSGDTLIGYTDVTFTAAVPDIADTRPTVDMELSPVSTLVQTFSGLYIQGKTKVTADFSDSAGKYGASISMTKDITVGGLIYLDPPTSDFLQQSGTVTVTGVAMDTRGINGSANGNISVIEYSKPKVIPYTGYTGIICERSDVDGNKLSSGTYLHIKCGRSYSKVMSGETQKNFCLLRYRYKAESAASYSAWTTCIAKSSTETDYYEAIIPGVATPVTTLFYVEIGVIDDIGEVSSIVLTVPADTCALHLADGGKRIGILKYNPDFDGILVGGNVKLEGDLTLGANAVTDFVTENGTETQTDGGVWLWRKWASGKREAWYRRNLGQQTLTSYNTALYTNSTIGGASVTMPSGLFTEAPIAIANMETNAFTMCQAYGATSVSVSYRAWQTYQSNPTCIINIYCCGK